MCFYVLGKFYNWLNSFEPCIAPNRKFNVFQLSWNFSLPKKRGRAMAEADCTYCCQSDSSGQCDSAWTLCEAWLSYFKLQSFSLYIPFQNIAQGCEKRLFLPLARLSCMYINATSCRLIARASSGFEQVLIKSWHLCRESVCKLATLLQSQNDTPESRDTSFGNLLLSLMKAWITERKKVVVLLRCGEITKPVGCWWRWI